MWILVMSFSYLYKDPDAGFDAIPLPDPCPNLTRSLSEPTQPFVRTLPAGIAVGYMTIPAYQ
jgi:hypothetical protein